MPQLHGPITDRLVAEFGPTSDGWSPPRDAALRTKTRPAAVGYRIGPRRRSGRRTFWLDFTTSLLNITAPSLALWLLLLVTQAERLMYIAHTVVILP